MSDNHTGTTAETAAVRQTIGDGEATRAVTNYVRQRFWLPNFTWDKSPNEVLRMNAAQWEAIRAMLERALELDDLSVAFQLVRGRDFHALSYDDYADDDPDNEDDEDDEDDELDESGYHVVEPHADPALPNGWLTLLEASYEQLGDVDGLERFYEYCILTDIGMEECGHGNENEDENENTEDEIHHDTESGTVHRTYLDRLRDLVNRTAAGNHQVAAERWSRAVDAIITAFETADAMEYPVERTQAYERLLLEERLGDAAWKYCERRIRDPWARSASSIALVERFLDVFTPDHAAEACELLLKPLHDADSELMRDDSAEHRQDIVRILTRCRPYMGVERVRAETERLLRMYRRRRELQESLKEFLNGLNTATPTAATE